MSLFDGYSRDQLRLAYAAGLGASILRARPSRRSRRRSRM